MASREHRTEASDLDALQQLRQPVFGDGWAGVVVIVDVGVAVGTAGNELSLNYRRRFEKTKCPESAHYSTAF